MTRQQRAKIEPRYVVGGEPGDRQAMVAALASLLIGIHESEKQHEGVGEVARDSRTEPAP